MSASEHEFGVKSSLTGREGRGRGWREGEEGRGKGGGRREEGKMITKGRARRAKREIRQGDRPSHLLPLGNASNYTESYYKRRYPQEQIEGITASRPVVTTTVDSAEKKKKTTTGTSRQPQPRHASTTPSAPRPPLAAREAHNSVHVGRITSSFNDLDSSRQTKSSVHYLHDLDLRLPGLICMICAAWLLRACMTGGIYVIQLLRMSSRIMQDIDHRNR